MYPDIKSYVSWSLRMLIYVKYRCLLIISWEMFPYVISIDISTPGASCIYSLLGAREYAWRFIASDIDAVALQHAAQLVAENGLEKQITLRHAAFFFGERWWLWGMGNLRFKTPISIYIYIFQTMHICIVVYLYKSPMFSFSDKNMKNWQDCPIHDR